MRPTQIDPLFVQAVRNRARLAGVYDGRQTPESQAVIACCRHVHRVTGTVLLFTRDGDFHAAGWIKNPEYARCWHLSLSFFDPRTGTRSPHNRKLADLWCKLIFGNSNLPKLLVESPKSAEGKRVDVWHYRLFADAHWQPIVPRGEPYHTLRTETGWTSWSERCQTDKEPAIIPAETQ